MLISHCTLSVLHKEIGALLLPLKLLRPQGINTRLQVPYLSYLPLLPRLKQAYVQCNKTLQQITAAELWITRGPTYATQARPAATEASSWLWCWDWFVFFCACVSFMQSPRHSAPTIVRIYTWALVLLGAPGGQMRCASKHRGEEEDILGCRQEDLTVWVHQPQPLMSRKCTHSRPGDINQRITVIPQALESGWSHCAPTVCCEHSVCLKFRVL